MSTTKTARANETKYAAAGYTHLLCYAELHNEYGYSDEVLPFMSEAEARRWVADVNAAWEAGKVSYRVGLHYVRAF